MKGEDEITANTQYKPCPITTARRNYCYRTIVDRHRTKECVEKRLTQGHTKLEALRCVKRYIAREVYYSLRKRNNLINNVQIVARHIEGHPRQLVLCK